MFLQVLSAEYPVYQCPVKTRHSLWPSCNIQQLLGAIYDNIISPHGTWLSAELFAGDLPHWQIRYGVSNISFSRATAQNYILWYSASVTMLMPKLISHPITDEIINTIPLWPQIRLFGFFFFGWGEGLYLFFFPFPIFFFSFSTLIFFWIFLLKIQRDVCMRKVKTEKFYVRQKKLEKIFYFLLPFMTCQIKSFKKKIARVFYPQNY